MKVPVFYAAGQIPAIVRAQDVLQRHGLRFTDTPGQEVTHLLLGVPAFEKDGSLKGGGCLTEILNRCGSDIWVFGGNLNCESLKNYHTVDLLQDPYYVAENADITAHCAIKVALRHMDCTLKGCPVLVIGGGRIGTCLAKLLKALGAQVCVAVRQKRALWEVLGYETLNSNDLGYSLGRFRLIFNTVPAPVITEEALRHCREDCIKIELASQPGIAGTDVVNARGLPNLEAPETSGNLIARTVLRRYQEGVL